MPFKILEHTADVGIIAKGKTFKNALEEAARGMFFIMGSSKSKSAVQNKTEKIKISIGRENKEELVVFLFSEILAQCEINKFTPIKMNVKFYNGKTILVEVLVEYKMLNEKLMFKNIIKAITFHMLKVKHEKDYWKIQVLFDV